MPPTITFQESSLSQFGFVDALTSGMVADGSNTTPTDNSPILRTILASAGSNMVVIRPQPGSYYLGSQVVLQGDPLAPATTPLPNAVWVLPGVTFTGPGSVTVGGSVSGGLVLDMRKDKFVLSNQAQIGFNLGIGSPPVNYAALHIGGQTYSAVAGLATIGDIGGNLAATANNDVLIGTRFISQFTAGTFTGTSWVEVAIGNVIGGANNTILLIGGGTPVAGNWGFYSLTGYTSYFQAGVTINSGGLTVTAGGATINSAGSSLIALTGAGAINLTAASGQSVTLTLAGAGSFIVTGGAFTVTLAGAVSANGRITAGANYPTTAGGIVLMGGVLAFTDEIEFASPGPGSSHGITTAETGAGSFAIEHRGVGNTGSFLFSNGTAGGTSLLGIGGSGLVTIYLTGLNMSAGTLLNTAAPTVNGAGFNLSPGIVPTDPVDGDLYYDGTNLWFNQLETPKNLLIPSLSTVTNTLGGDVTLTSAGTYYDGPSCAQGAAGTWEAFGSVEVTGTASDVVQAKLWDGTTVIASAQVELAAVTGTQVTIHLSGIITTPAANIRISVSDATTSATPKIRFNQSGNSKDSTLTVVRIG